MEQNLDEQKTRAERLLQESQTSIVGGSTEEGLRLAQEAFSIFQTIDDRYGLASACNNIGIASAEIGDYPRALEMYRTAIDIWTDLGRSIAVASALHNLGRVLQETGDFPAALDYFLRARAINEELKSPLHLAHNLVSIGMVYAQLSDSAKAIAVLEEALPLYEQLGSPQGTSNVFSNMGKVFLEGGELDRAVEYFTKALRIREELDEEYHAQHMVLSIGIVHVIAGRTDEARRFYERAMKVDITEPALRFDRYQLGARICAAGGDLDAARLILMEALSEAEQYNIRPSIAGVHELLRDQALLRNDLPSYVLHNNAFTAITEEISGKEASIRIAMQTKEREFESREREYQKHLAVLHSTLPKDVADRVARGEVVNDHYDNASVLFLDIVGFTALSSTMSSADVISLLDDVFSQCDAICAKHGITKIKTIGDSYMAFGTANTEQRTANTEHRTANTEQRTANKEHRTSNTEQRTANAALEMMKIELNDALKKALEKALEKALVKFRIGIHTGPVTAGVIGKDRFQYDVWGDTVNIASRMESTSEPGRIHVTEEFAQRCGHPCIPREAIEIKGRGMMKTFWMAQ